MWLHRGDGLELVVFSPESGGFARHSHDEYVLGVNLTGVEHVRLDRHRFAVGTDEVTCYNPGQIQSCTTSVPAGTAWSYVGLYVAPSLVRSLTGGRLADFHRP